jgi:hypothetical protein
VNKFRLLSASTVIVAGAALFVADSFLPWNRACRGKCLNFNLWHGAVGIEAGVAAIAVLAFESSTALGRTPRLGVEPSRVGAVGAGLVLFFTVLKIGVDHAYLFIGAWLGLALAVGVAYLAYTRVYAALRLPRHEGATAGPEEGTGQ